jgi:heme A synthase
MAIELRAFQLLSLATAVSVYILIVIGGLVASTGSGLACPDWPLCNGQVFPTFTTPYVVVEYTHRVWTLVVTALVIATTAVAWKKYHWENKLTKISTVTFILLLGQIILGMITVDTRTLPLVVTSHLALATLVFASALATSFVSLTQRGR